MIHTHAHVQDDWQRDSLVLQVRQTDGEHGPTVTLGYAREDADGQPVFTMQHLTLSEMQNRGVTHAEGNVPGLRVRWDVAIAIAQAVIQHTNAPADPTEVAALRELVERMELERDAARESVVGGDQPMSTPDRSLGDWAIHYQEPYKDDAMDRRFPMPLRVYFLAMGNHRANGHANFKKQQIAKVLGRLDETTGELIPADRRTVNRAIRQAIELGLLTEGSKALCLIVPAHRVTGGKGDENEPCTRHPRPEAQAVKARPLRVVS